MNENFKNTDWATAKGIADEATLSRFIQSLGGKRFDEIVPNPPFENADFCFSEHKVVIELKILEKEFYKTQEFEKKRNALLQRWVKEKGLRGPLLGQPYPKEFLQDFDNLLRPPLAGIVKKANRQIKTTKEYLQIPDASGVLLCVNDNLRDIPPQQMMRLFCRILNGDCSSITAIVYLTNHYVLVPGNAYANLLWTTAYSENAPDTLPDWINWLGRQWGLFIEKETGPLDSKIETPDGTILAGSRAIKRG